MAQVALVGGLVVDGQALGAGPISDGVSDRVAEVGGEPALLDVEHLVPAARAVEAEPDPVRRLRKRVLELVAVVEDRLRRDGGLEPEVGEPADPSHGIPDLAGFGLELSLVRKILEAAAAAGRIVRAGRLDAVSTGLEHLDRDRLGVASLHLGDTRSHGVARKAATDEDDEAVQPRDAVAAVGERVDPELELLVAA